MSYLEPLRAGYGLCQLLKPDFIATKILRHKLDAKATMVVRVLGARHVLQAVVIILAPGSPFLRRGSAGLDLLHAATMGIVGATDRRRRQAALADAAVACAFAAAELLEVAARRAGRRSHG